ncbi:3-oxoacyl-[acyl-carrier-protein] reductase FabG [Buchnera aphidicola (Mindarus abietinus)]
MNKKIVLITGATQGIGRSIAEGFIKKKKLVIGMCSSNKNKIIIEKYLKKNGIGMVCNIQDSFSVRECINYININFGSIDILINNAGIAKNKLLFNTTLSEWNESLLTNLTSVFLLSKLVLRNMIKKNGRIITIGSIIGQIGNIGQTSYAASKSALIGFNKSLALEVARFGITVNLVFPGFIKTKMTDNLNQSLIKKYLSKIPTRKFGTPSDVSNAVLFLASEKASYITGQTLHVNGGMYMI